MKTKEEILKEIERLENRIEKANDKEEAMRLGARHYALLWVLKDDK